eukprot:comp21658_c0_seq1/m.47986 comp21658_c0_seq1/g.47986  ORF comp21658_c0_seq1/g.47986 comp21658_c0_seq1/m.47986 type:complete len:367 (-) comp21658_c0_seq1:272-1372(-)
MGCQRRRRRRRQALGHHRRKAAQGLYPASRRNHRPRLPPARVSPRIGLRGPHRALLGPRVPRARRRLPARTNSRAHPAFLPRRLLSAQCNPGQSAHSDMGATTGARQHRCRMGQGRRYRNRRHPAHRLLITPGIRLAARRRSRKSRPLWRISKHGNCCKSAPRQRTKRKQSSATKHHATAIFIICSCSCIIGIGIRIGIGIGVVSSPTATPAESAASISRQISPAITSVTAAAAQGPKALRSPQGSSVGKRQRPRQSRRAARTRILGPLFLVRGPLKESISTRTFRNGPSSFHRRRARGANRVSRRRPPSCPSAAAAVSEQRSQAASRAQHHGDNPRPARRARVLHGAHGRQTGQSQACAHILAVG